MSRLAVVVAMAVVLAAAASANSGKSDEEGLSSPISYPSSLIPKDDAQLTQAIVREPAMLRGNDIEASLKVVDYFMARPGLTFRIIDTLQGAPFSLEPAEESDEWELTASSRFYTLKNLGAKSKTRVLKFTFFFRFPLGIGIKTSGAGLLVIRVRKAKEENNAVIDYDIYLVTGSLPIDKLTKSLPFIQSGLAQSDFESVLTAFAKLCESVADDPDSLAEEMAGEEETFTVKEVKEFRKAFIRPGKGVR